MSDVIRESLKGLRAAKAKMQEEISRIDAAILALSGDMNNSSSATPRAAKPKSKRLKKSRGTKTMSNTFMVTEVMKKQEKGVPFADIIDLVASEYNGHRIQKTSLSPLLTKLRKRGDLKLVDGIWFYKKFAPEMRQADLIGHNEQSPDH